MPDQEGKQRDRHQTGLTDLPPEVVLDHLLPVMGDKDIGALSGASKELNVICVSMLIDVCRGDVES